MDIPKASFSAPLPVFPMIRRRGYPVFDPSAPLSVLYRTILSQSILALKRPSIGKPFLQTCRAPVRPAALPRCRLPCSSPQLKWWRLHSDALPRCRAPRLPCSWLLPLPSSHPPTHPGFHPPFLPVSSQAAFPGKPGKSPENEYSSAFPTLISETAWKLFQAVRVVEATARAAGNLFFCTKSIVPRRGGMRVQGSTAIALFVICVPLLYQGLSGRLLPNLGRLLHRILAGTNSQKSS